MDWAEDFKFTLKKSAKKGRRAAQNTSTVTTSSPTATTAQEDSTNDKPGTGTTLSTPEQELSLLDRDFDDDINDFDVKEMMKTKKTGGWATDEPVKFGKNNKSNTNLIEQERFNSITSTSNLSDDDIPVIPDLDDIKDEILLNEMVEAPTVSVNRVATYKELNSDLLKQSAFSTLEDVDLSILAKCLQNEIYLNEPDEIWTWDKLFTEISAEIHSEKPQSASAIDRSTNNGEIMTKYVE